MTNKETEAARDWCKNQFVNNGENGIISPELSFLAGIEWKKQQSAPVNVGEEKSAEEILSKHTGETGIYLTHGMIRGSDALEAMKEYKNQSLPAPVEGEGDYKTALEDALPIVIAFSAIQTHGNLPVHPQHKELIDRIGKLITKK